LDRSLNLTYNFLKIRLAYQKDQNVH